MPASGNPRFSRTATPSVYAARCTLRFLRAQFRRATGAHFTGGEIEDPCAMSLSRELDQGAAARELCVVTVREDRENVQISHARNLTGYS